jgi:hypothetical protein
MKDIMISALDIKFTGFARVLHMYFLNPPSLKGTGHRIGASMQTRGTAHAGTDIIG